MQREHEQPGKNWRAESARRVAFTWRGLAVDREARTLAGLAAAALITRLPFHAALLNNFDAVNYALALERFDMRLAQPQAPGYPLYVLLGRFFHLFIPDAAAALNWLSTVFSALAVMALYLAGRQLLGRRAGLIGALGLLVSSVFWYTGEIAAPYTADLFFSALAGCLCALTWQHARQDRPTSLRWWAALAVGLAGALRVQSFVFLFPLLWFALTGGLRWKTAFQRPALANIWLPAGLSGLVTALFFIPAVYLSGGPASFLTSMQGILPIFRDGETLVRSTRLVRFAGNLYTLLRYTVQTLGEPLALFLAVGLAALALPGARYLRRALSLRRQRELERSPVLPGALGLHRYRMLERSLGLRRHPELERPATLQPQPSTASPVLGFLLVWLLPAWLVFVLIWPGNVGTVLVSMPPLFLLAAAGLEDLWLRRPKLAGAALLGILAWGVIAFVALPARPFGERYREFDNLDNLRQATAYYERMLAAIAGYPAQDTLLFSDDFRHPQVYLPEHRLLTYPRFSPGDAQQVRLVVEVQGGEVHTWRAVPAEILIPPTARRLVLINPSSKIHIAPELAVQQTVQGEGRFRLKILVIELPAAQAVTWTADGLQVNREEIE